MRCRLLAPAVKALARRKVVPYIVVGGIATEKVARGIHTWEVRARGVRPPSCGGIWEPTRGAVVMSLAWERGADFMSAGLCVCRAFAATLPSAHVIVCRFDCTGGLSIRLKPESRLWRERSQVGCRISNVCDYSFAPAHLFCDRRLMITWSTSLVRPFERQHDEITTLIPLSVSDPRCCRRKTAGGAIAALDRHSQVPVAQLCIAPAWDTLPGLTRASE